MTLEQIIESPSLWEALSPTEQEAFFAPMLDVTRPDRETAIHKETKSSRGGKGLSDRQLKFLSLSKEKQQMMKAILDEEGIEL
jgi:hypothetical protein